MKRDRVASAATDRPEYELTASVVHRLDESLAREIDALAAVAIEPNAFYESWVLAAALEHIKAAELTLVLVRDRSRSLTGLFPLSVTRRFRRLPVRSLRSWLYLYSPLGSPLIASGHVNGTLAALLDWLQSSRAPASVLDLVSIRADGPIAEALSAALQQRKHFAVHQSLRQRALLDLRAAPATGVSGRHQKELRRKQRRLQELGDIQYRVLAPDQPADEWIERFLAIELAGWKGSEGTAMGFAPGDRAFFRQITQQAHDRGQLHMLELAMDGKAIASKCNLLSKEGAFMFKIAFDQEYAKYSPGLLLELFNMEYLRRPDCSHLAWADSCARSEHFMIDRLWVDRRRIGYYAICGRGLLARNIIRHGYRIQRTLRRVRGIFRRG